MTANLTQREFARHLNTTFTVHLDDGDTVPVQLIRASPYRDNVPEESGMERFTLLFEGDPAIHLEQKCYRFQHDQMGEFDMFVVPIAHGQTHAYEAVFNYFVNKDNG